MFSTIASTIRSLFSLGNTASESPLSGAEAVRQAVMENEELQNRTYEATLLEPDVEQFGGMFKAKPRVMLPVMVDAPVDPGTLIFDLPEGRDDEESLFMDLLDCLDATLTEMEHIEGETVPVRFVNGNPVVAWDELRE